MCNNKVINILVTLDLAYLDPATVMLTSLFFNNHETKFIVHIATTSTEVVNQLKNRLSKWDFEIVCYYLNPTNFSDFKISSHASVANYYRIYLGNFLPNDVKRVLYLDTDIIVNGSVQKFYSLNIGDSVFGAVEEINIGSKKKESLGLRKEDSYFNSGVLLVDVDKWKSIQLTEKLVNFIKDYPHLLELWDQDALNAVCKKIWCKLPIIYNYLTSYSLQKLEKKPLIIHYTGKSKPWQYMDRHPYKKIFKKFANLAGVKKSDNGNKTIGNFLRKYKLMPSFVEKRLTKK